MTSHVCQTTDHSFDKALRHQYEIPQITGRLNITFFVFIWISKHLTIDTAYQRGAGTGFSSFFRVIFSFFSEYEGWNFNSGNYLFTTDTK